MNKAYRSIWNESTGTWIAAPETAKSNTGNGSTARGASFNVQAKGWKAPALKAMSVVSPTSRTASTRPMR
ncbi:ESPR domain-containing protein [Paraburkholderia acidiphila]|uniref:ESPR domain-containing protein n=1 Tax=Paraburkholderia acidiphila TaxID=2571747 RepID=A0A7Z2G214_9BURK|nr:ESPR domain-containing protein [Paraburkholderia acidiphila]QGZ53775.1 hypothetical protein FAZ97_01980 [Paraburkholderia acidiphila]